MKYFLENILPNYEEKKVYVTTTDYGAPKIQLWEQGDLACFHDGEQDPDSGKQQLPTKQAF